MRSSRLTAIIAASWIVVASAANAFAQQPEPPPAPAPATPEDHSTHAGMAQATAEQPRAPIPPLTDADRAAAFPDVNGHEVHDGALNYFVLFDQFEWQVGEGTQGVNWDTKSWVGGDRNRIWVRSEGETGRARVDHAEGHVLYGRAISRWWDLVGGVRQDFRPGPARTWAAIGLQGLAPQWFEIEATAYVGAGGRTHLRLEAEYDLLLTNRLVLQPLVEMEFYGKSDPERRIGPGLSTADAGVRIRYEVRREVAPYLGLVWQRRFAGTADFARAAGQDVGAWRAVGGVRLWF